MKKSVPVKGTSPSISSDAKFPARYSTGSKGRAYPSGCDKLQTAKGNPPKGGKK